MQFFKQKSIKIFFLVVLLGIIIYLPSFHAPFQFDDYRIIVNNILIKNIKEFVRIWRWDPSRFLSHMTFAWNYSLSRKDVFSYHVVNFLLHLATTASVFTFISLLLWKFCQDWKDRERSLIAFGASLIFLTHPVQSSAVTYIVQRSAILATLFYVLSMIGYILFREQGKNRYYILSVISALLGCFCKPIIITLPFAIAMYEHLRNYPQREHFLKTLRRIFPYFIVVLLVPLLLIMWRYKSADLSKYGDITRETTYLTRPEYLLTQINVVRTYLRLLIAPVYQNLDYDYPITRSLFNLPTLLSLGLLISLLVVGIRCQARKKILAFAIFWFFITLSLESSIFPIADVIFEHRLYLPLAGFCVLFPVFVYLILKDQKILKRILVVLITIFSVMTFQRNLVWKNAVKFMEQVESLSSEKSRVQNSLGFAYYKAGELKKAEKAFKKCLEITPAGVISSRARNNLGILYFDQGKYTKAIEEFQKALKFSESDHSAAIAYNHMGRVFLEQGKMKKAIEYYTQAISLSPLMFEAFNNRGAIFRKQGMMDAALRDYDIALKINPMDEDVYSNKGLLFRIEGKYDAALEEYKHAIKANSKNAQNYYDRGIVYKEMKDYKKAVEDFNQALSLKNDYKEVYNERGIIFSKAHKYDFALADYNQALSLDPDFFDAYYNRALLYFKKKEYVKAINDSEQAILLDSKFINAYYLKALALYRLKDYTEADKVLLQLLKIDPNFTKAVELKNKIPLEK